MDETDKTRLLEEFRQYLDATTVVEEETGQTDLFSLFGELAALRTEVRTESRQFRTALDTIGEAHEWLRNSQENLSRTVERFQGEFSTLRRDTLRPALLDLLDLHDRLSAGLDALRNYRPVKGWFRIKSRREDRRFIESIREGQGMSLRRLEEILARHEIRPIEVMGLPVDPHSMKVLELDRQPKLENGVVTAELRKGFLWGDEVLRLAEVRANKL
ncbi:GrpE protein [Methylocaldum marinum]|uniref:GrpE protein n=1 Tax=Methylocaldum marinum TaxID=1432792 RepID=A0A250KW75_9GAMM|nr:nucleotide exchange factor GrpE [Methylocaldum marinum]BBA35867.1 GrpE protein [Methylocaldum marinum]